MLLKALSNTYQVKKPATINHNSPPWIFSYACYCMAPNPCPPPLCCLSYITKKYNTKFNGETWTLTSLHP